MKNQQIEILKTFLHFIVGIDLQIVCAKSECNPSKTLGGVAI
jgi:hypothetical protein